MKYVVFSIVLLSVGYLLPTALVLRRPCRQREIEWISPDLGNVCKGFAILIIMLGHTGNCFGVRYLTPLGSWGVGIFLFLSGYGLECSVQKKGLHQYWKKRILTAYLPYMAAELLGILFQIGAEYQNASVLDVILDLLLIKTIHPFGWYMQCLFLFYAAFFLANKLYAAQLRKKYVLLGLTAAALFLLFDDLYKQQLFSFLLGVFAANNISFFRRKTESVWFPCSIFAVGGIFLAIRQMSFVRQLHWVLYNGIFALQVGFLTVGTILLLFCLYRRLHPGLFEIMLYVGLISYELYLYHGFVYSSFAAGQVSCGRIAGFWGLSFLIAVVMFWLKRMIMRKGQGNLSGVGLFPNRK